MRVRIWPMLCVFVLTFGFASAARAQSMKLLAPNVGWIVPARNRILWTNDGGASWKDITPLGQKDSMVSGIFFLDTNRGWVLLAHGERDVPGGLQFNLATTDNAGASWSMKHLTVPDRKYSGSDILGGGILAFADSLHGWLALSTHMGPAFEGMGILLKTSDGGETWKLATATGWYRDDTIGPMLMQTPEQGWMIDGGANEQLLATKDGGRTWNTVELKSPVTTDRMRKYDQNFDQFERSFQRTIPLVGAGKESQHPSYAAYDLPTFEDRKHGHICVTYPGAIVLFRTDDGGVTWKPDRVLTGLLAQETGWKAASAVVDSTWITGSVPKKGMPKLRKLGPEDHSQTNTAPRSEDFNVMQMSFATPSQGWIETNYSKLLSTNDGGASWTDITPGRKPKAATP
jgi:photosystem II stability/assembly factor-like uncharacterized protein